MSQIIKTAQEKIDKELKEFKGGNKEKIVSTHVAKTLKQFCQNVDFATSVNEKKGTLSDCCKTIMEKTGSSVSDIEVYRKAASFYFPKTKINFTMEIQLDMPERISTAKSYPKKESKSNDSIQISLF